MRMLFIAIALSMPVLLSSCGERQKAKITSICDLEVTPSPERIIVVCDVGKSFGPKFKTAFNEKFLELSRQSSKPLELMPYIEFVRSPYNKPDANESFSKILFVFITTRGTRTEGSHVTSAMYLLEAKYLNNDPFLVQDINLDYGGAYELARAVCEELKTRKIL